MAGDAAEVLEVACRIGDGTPRLSRQPLRDSEAPTEHLDQRRQHLDLLWGIGGEVVEAAIGLPDELGGVGGGAPLLLETVLGQPPAEVSRLELEGSDVDDLDADTPFVVAVVGGGCALDAEVIGPVTGIEGFIDGPVDVQDVGGGDPGGGSDPGVVGAACAGAGGEVEDDEVPSAWPIT